MRSTLLPPLLVLVLTNAACQRAPRGARATNADTTSARAIARDAAERPLTPVSGGVLGALTLERVAIERATLDRAPAPVQVAPSGGALEPAPPVAEPGEPPAREAPERGTAEPSALQPPIPRGAPVVVRGGRGGRVTLDVRVDEAGEVSDALVVEAGADSLAASAAEQAARAQRYHPALLGGRPVAVWTRQTIRVERP